MDLFEKMAAEGHEQVMFFRDKAGGKLKAIVAFHDSTLGPPLGGTRMYPYASEEEAVTDALRLAKGMTLKSAASGLNHGGVKGIIWGDPEKDKDEILLRAYGRFIEGLKGRFITGTDVGTYSMDFVDVSAETKYVVGLPVEYGGSGDTSILTAYGVFLGVKACVEEVTGKDSLAGIKVAVQGVGKVGSKLCRHLKEAGASVILTDVRREMARSFAEEIGASYVEPDEILTVEADVFSPNALGAVLNEKTIPLLKCRIVCGGANNQLATPEDADRLYRRGILYAPDYVVNAGGVIQVADELMGFNRDRAKLQVERIPSRLKTIFAISKREGVNTELAATRMVEERIKGVLKIRATMA
ncbi:MAG TPA: Glu/Leu/Phe/Val dehydrogenase [Firmicutes bacterium]|nr:Glu/Leu/Phe/Val dehydrogenase [Candidatus Fermentithermobacillaceae bacterium]